MDLEWQHAVVDGNRLTIRTAGSGTPLVFVHGWMCDSQDMEPLAAALVNDHRVALVDLRAHGASEGTPTDATEADGADGPGRFGLTEFARDVIGVVQQLDLAPALLVGHSMGAGVVLEAAHARPDLIRGVLLIASRWAFTAASAEQLAAGPALWGEGYSARRANMEKLRRQVLPNVSIDLPVQEVAAQSSRSLLAWDGRTALRDSPVPVCAVVPDKNVPFTEPARKWKPDLMVAHIPGTGHWVHVERPTAVAAALRRFESGLTS
jgi:pimeloyl-ACP methyl ester carboxylesterase